MDTKKELMANESNVNYYGQQYPVTFEKAKDHLIETDQGVQYIDFLAGAGSLNYGHNPDRIINPLINYLSQAKILNSLDLNTTAKRQFMDSFRKIILQPRNLNYLLQFTGPTGTNSVEAALKLARKVTGRNNVIAFTNGFHGMSLGALAATGNRSKRAGAGQALHNVTHMPFDGYFGNKINTLDFVEKMLEDSSSGIDLPAAFIVETVQGEGGLNVASSEWLIGLYKLAKRFGALFIVDDIQAGCGRTGSFFSFERAHLHPDMVCLSKSISGCGLPMALVLLKPELDIWKPGEHNGTFRGNNLAFVAANAALEYWQDPLFEASIHHKANLIKQHLLQSISGASSGQVKLVGLGMFQGVEFADPQLAQDIASAAFKSGVLIETCGANDQVIKLMPPITIHEEALLQGLTILRQVINEHAAHLFKLAA